MSLAPDGIGGALRRPDHEHIFKDNYEDNYDNNDGDDGRLHNGGGNDDAEEDKYLKE